MLAGNMPSLLVEWHKRNEFCASIFFPFKVLFMEVLIDFCVNERMTKCTTVMKCK